RPLLGKSEAELTNWRDTLREALEPNGRLMVDLVPELRLIIGDQPPVPELAPQDAQRRFQLVFRRFIGVFARPEHPLALFLDDLRRLIADALRCELERAAPLAQLVHDKTAGNPFFVIQFLHALAEGGLLTFDAGDAHWSWDLDRIHAKDYTDNVVELMVGKLARLPAETQTALQQLACL